MQAAGAMGKLRGAFKKGVHKLIQFYFLRLDIPGAKEFFDTVPNFLYNVIFTKFFGDQRFQFIGADIQQG